MTIPRLELNGALIAARLCSYNVPEASTQVQNWKDHLLNRQLSCSSLDWRPFCSVQTRRSKPAQRDHQFNRALVLEVLPQRWQPSRFTIWSITATQLISCNHWWNGYSFSARMLMAVRLEDYIEYTRGRETIFRWWKWTLLKTQNPSLNRKGFSSLRQLLRVTA